MTDEQPYTHLYDGSLDEVGPSFVHLGDDVWVNPAHVVSLHPSDGGCLIGIVSGHAMTSPKPLHDVLALLTGESEAS